MKQLLFIIILLFGIHAFGQNLYRGLQVLKSDTTHADYMIDGEWRKGTWRIAPEVSPDVLEVQTFNHKIPFAFYTDHDSIKFTIEAGKSVQFYVLQKEKEYALTEIKGLPLEKHAYKSDQSEPAFKFVYETDPDNDFLKQLKAEYPIEAVAGSTGSDTEKALKVLNWVHRQWKHNGNNEPSRSDALSILQEVKEGKNFRCVEYGIVAASCLNAIGLKARVIGMMTKDVETRQYGAGHVALEVYLNDLQKWVFLDGQFDVMPVLNGVPLNAVEFQQAIIYNYEDLEIKSLSNTSKSIYLNWIFPYLFYFDVKFDNREGIAIDRVSVNGKTSLTLVPDGAKAPDVFQIHNPITKRLFTNNYNYLYAKP